MFPLHSLFWCMIQVGMIACIGLVVCWTLRGTRPQFTTAMLSGCAMASLLFGGLACLPATHWSVRDSIMVAWMAPTAPSSDPLSSSETSPGLPDAPLSHTSNTSATTPNSGSDSANETAASPVPTMLIRWFLVKVQSIDESVRNVEKSSKVSQSNWGESVPWVLGVGIGLMTGFWFHGWLWMRWMVRNSERLSSDALDHRIDCISQQMHVRRRPTLRVSDRIPIGATVGILRPAIILNRDWQRWSDHELDTVLLHELAHIARHDFFWVVVGSWVRVFFFFHPLMHLLVHRWRVEQELAADQLAASWMKDARAYGRALASLALRADCSVRPSGPVLSAEQICVIRRITMLKQDYLVPRRHGWKWGAAITFLTFLSFLPLTGLRGTPPEFSPTGERSAKKAFAERSDRERRSIESSPSIAEDSQQIQTQLQSLEKENPTHPPLRFAGDFIWNPKQFLSLDFDPRLRWLHNFFRLTLFGTSTAEGSIHGRSYIVWNWSDSEKVHFDFKISTDITEADQLNPKVMTQILTQPSAGGLVSKQSNQVKLIEGRQASALTRMFLDPETGSLKESNFVTWVVDDELGFLQGSESSIADRLRGKSTPFATIPADLLEPYRTAALAVVFTDCASWKRDWQQHFEGSEHQNQSVIVSPLFDGLQRLSIFVSGSDEYDCTVRADYSTVENAETSKKTIDGLLALAHLALASMPNGQEGKMLSELLKSLEVAQTHREVRIRCNPPTSFDEPILSESLPGWFSLLGTANPSNEEPNTVRFQVENAGCCPSFFTQTISAEKIRGKRVRLSADLGCNLEERARTGLVLWASKHDGRSTTAASISADGTSNLAAVATHDTYDPPRRTEQGNCPLSLEFDIDEESDVLSLGVYAKQTEVLISNVRLEVVGPVRMDPITEVPISPLNLLRVPSVPIYPEPWNLDFTETRKSVSTDVPGVAQQEKGTLRK